jgi:septum site-determining protein MinC
MQNDGILFKWEEGNLIIRLDEELDFDYLLRNLKKKTLEAENFFVDSKIKIEAGKRELSSKHKDELIDIFISLPGLSLIEIVKDDSVEDSEEAESELESELSTLLFDKTLRSGQSLKYDGNIVVRGDVNPGASITAKGDIIVMGTFRGLAHAGATGREEATITAFRLRATQLRIGNRICRAPDGEVKHPDKPEIALIQEETILIKDLKN